jgi:hypothetical protein
MERLDNPYRPRPRPLLTMREWWWNRDRRRHVAEMIGSARRHLLDEDYVIEAMTRQLEEILNLPEITLEGEHDG